MNTNKDSIASVDDSLINKYCKLCIFRKFNKHNSKYLNIKLYYTQALQCVKTYLIIIMETSDRYLESFQLVFMTKY